MSENQILDQIIANNQFEQAVNLNAIEIVAKLFNQLNEREQDVLKRRFGLATQKKQTLEEIGKDHSLTRERIRQIETSSIAKIKKNKDMEEIVSSLRKTVSQLLEEHGGLIARDYLFDILTNLSTKDNSLKNNEVHRNHLNFLIGKILNDDFDKVGTAKHISNIFKFKHQELDYLNEIADELTKKIEELDKLYDTKELIELIKNSDSYKKHGDKIKYSNNININEILGSDYADLDNNEKGLYSLITAINGVDKNKFGYWGYAKSREVKPKTINDKIYLVLKNHGEPMYYGDIAKKIEEICFDKKSVNVATAHNELILDDKYVLIGRGLYGLKEWGYETGTVADIITNVLKQANEPLTKEEIADRVLKQRQVKQSTVSLALMDRTKFTREGNKYSIKQ
ncbi:MAG: sigma factor-like helix-turn-helix DNA-binding protein [bacterium]